MDDAINLVAFGGFFLFTLVISRVMIMGLWKAFVKAGKPGWACLVPIYNVIVMLEIAGLPLWMIVGLFIPFVNFFVNIYICHNVSKRFGGGVGMTILMRCGIGWLIIGFGNAKYNPNVA